MILLLSLVFGASAEEPLPVVGRVSRVQPREVPAMACHTGFSGAAAVSDLTKQVIALYPQFAEWKKTSCGNYTVEVKAGYGVCSEARDGTSELCSNSSGTTETSECMSREEALREQVTRLEACPGITPAPRRSYVQIRRAN